MQFKDFLLLVEQIDQLLIEADTIEWEPDTVSSFKHAPGVNRDTSQASQSPKLALPKANDIAFVQTPKGTVPAIVSTVDSSNVLLVNTKANVRVVKPVASFAPFNSPQLAAKYPGRQLWRVSATQQSTADLLR